MFDSIRKHQRLLQFLLLLLIFPAFALFGVSGYQQFMADDDSVASVGDSKISLREFDEARRAQFDRLRQLLGDQADAKLLDSPELVKRVIDELVVQRALGIEADRQRIAVTDDRLREAIGGIAGLRKPDGTFDLERYRALLSAQGMSEAMFEARTRSDLAIQAIPDAIGASAIVPKATAVQLTQLQEQVREVQELILRARDFAGNVKPTDEQLRNHYETNGQAFETRESAKVEYLVLSADAIARRITLSEDDVRSYYEQNKARYATPEERRASHILLKLEQGASDAQKNEVRARATELLKQVRAGGDFAALAKANSQDPGSAASGGDLGFFPREAMVKPFADAAFSLTEGEISGIVESDFGLHLIRLTGIRPGQQRGFEQVRAEIELELRKQQAGKQFAEAAEAFSNLVYEQSDTLQAAAERFKLEVAVANDVTRAGPAERDPKVPLANPKLLAALFSEDSIKTRRNTEAVDVGGSTLVSARIREHRPAKRRPFEEVADAVRAQVIEAEARKLAVQAGEARLKALRAGEGGEAGFSAVKPVSRLGNPVVAPAAIESIFRASAERLPAFVGVDLGADGYAVYRISKVSTPDTAEIEKGLQRNARQLAQAYGQQSVLDYVESLKARSKVTTHPERVVGKREPR